MRVGDVTEGIDFPHAAQVVVVYRERADLDVLASAETSYYVTSVAKHRAGSRAPRGPRPRPLGHREQGRLELRRGPPPAPCTRSDLTKLAATEIDPHRSTGHSPGAERRSVQMVLRLLAYNTEHDLARRLNAYLGDPDEYRAITRNLLHQGGRIDFESDAVTVTIDRPNQPRVARALCLPADELKATEAHLLGDPRPLIYRLAAS